MNDKLQLKNRLLEECLKLQKRSIDNAETAMNEAQQTANEYGQPRDRYDSFRTQILRKRDLFAEQLQNASKEINILEKVDPNSENNDVRFGSVVITNAQKMFVSISLGKIELEKDIFYAISPKVPFYKAMEGLKTGDSFELNGRKFMIEDIF